MVCFSKDNFPPARLREGDWDNKTVAAASTLGLATHHQLVLSVFVGQGSGQQAPLHLEVCCHHLENSNVAALGDGINELSHFFEWRALAPSACAAAVVVPLQTVLFCVISPRTAETRGALVHSQAQPTHDGQVLDLTRRCGADVHNPCVRQHLLDVADILGRLQRRQNNRHARHCAQKHEMARGSHKPKNDQMHEKATTQNDRKVKNRRPTKTNESEEDKVDQEGTSTRAR